MACVGKRSASTTGNNAIMGSLLAVDGLDDVLLHVLRAREACTAAMLVY